MDYGLKSKVVFITGAAQGIGKETAKRFAREGAYIALADVNVKGINLVKQEIIDKGGIAISIDCNVTDTQSVKNAIDEVRGVFSSVHILVNNAGIGSPFLGKRIIEMPEEHWDKMIAVHLRGAFLCTKYAIPFMLEQRWGRIINIGSIHGISGGRPGLANYAAAKAGVEGFTKASSLELAPYGITVNCVAPGFTRTPMLNVSQEMEEMMIKQTPVGKLAEAEDIANAILFLASEQASHITGITLRVDGGRSFYFLEQK